MSITNSMEFVKSNELFKMPGDVIIKLSKVILLSLLFFTWIITRVIYNILSGKMVRYILPGLHFDHSESDKMFSDVEEKFEKLPRHVILVVNNFQANQVKHLSQIIHWISVAKVKILSLYDPAGSLNNYLDDIRQQLKTISDEPPKMSFFNDKEWNREERDENALQIFAFQHPPDDIVKAAKDLMKGDNVDESVVDKAVNRSNGWPETIQCTEPELAMVFGNEVSTFGSIPWNIRLTEIHWLPPLTKVNEMQLYDSLQKYSSCEQRVGK